MATPFPMTPTREYPALMFYNGPRLGRAYNRLTHRIFERIMWTTSAATIKEFWKKEFGRAPDAFGNPFPRQVTPAMPTLVACSEAVFPRPADWPHGVYNTGYWFLDEEPGWQPPAELLRFLERGDPPVYVGFGSIGDPSAAEQTTRTVIEALQLAGQRGVLATGWSGMAQLDSLPEDIFILESAPHAWLFPRMAAVVHHGGAGTTAAGLRADVPAVVIPSGLDQFAWARRLHELGASAAPLPRKSLTAGGLAAAIRSALQREVVSAASALGEQIRSENGAAYAAQIIVETVNRKK
jgi:sterol 3beta-glucosyltransferase